MNDMTDTAPTDPYLVLPLEGVRLIEASAGTGKTFTLATLFTRLVVERGLRIGQILAVTFTEAATQELRRRIRERLALAVTLLPDADGNVAAASEAPDARLTATVLREHLQASGESVASLRRRLQQAVEEIDLSAIFTIHGFCARVLREHALESGQAFAAPELLANDRELLAEVAPTCGACAPPTRPLPRTWSRCGRPVPRRWPMTCASWCATTCCTRPGRSTAMMARTCCRHCARPPMRWPMPSTRMATSSAATCWRPSMPG
jgi:ATP-dependent exoDNAse (exonuclease V) beta subunit (contains helicase and exonuclease domains)